MWRLKILLLVCITAAVALNSASRSNAAELALRDLSGRRVRLQDYRGRIIVLNFWATWCSPCAREIPVFVNAHTEYQSSGIVFIGASLDNKKTRSKIPEFVKKYGINFPILVGATSDDLATITLGTVTPATVFIDRNGEIVARILGELHPDELTERIDWLLGNRAAPRPEALIRHLGGAL